MSDNSNKEMFRLGLILSQQEVTIIPRGQITISYAKLITGLLSLTLLLSTAMPILSHFIPSDLRQGSPTPVKNHDSKTDKN